MPVEYPRIGRERSTIHAMISIYCHDFHGTQQELCADCARLYGYAMQRLDKCVFKGDKPTCLKCPVHCYKKELREQVWVVMRYAGPKMLMKHPILAFWHLIDGRRKTPEIHKPRTGSG
jgi:predicted amidophosphoribosyltransferase